MTENKRFLIDDAGELIDLNNHKFIDYGDECCKLLNELHEENEKLKTFLKAVNEELSLANRDCDILEEENEQLKKENDMLSCELSVSANKEISRNCRIAELEEENKQLKQQLNRLYNYFEDWYYDMTSANDFNEIWDNVKEDERWGDPWMTKRFELRLCSNGSYYVYENGTLTDKQ